MNEPGKTTSVRGFTLVELMVIMVVLGILAAVSVPVFFDFGSYRERAAYDEVAGALRYAQKLAVASGCEVQAVIQSNGYALRQRADGCASGGFVNISGHPVTSNSFSGVLINPPTDIIFTNMGRSSVSATIGVGSKTIAVIAETGYVDAP